MKSGYSETAIYRDAFWQGTCDDGCQKLADLLGWGDELRELVKREWARIDAQPAGIDTAKLKATSKDDSSESTAAKM
uniref:Uncharacterized protein n=1 Tax=Plectus sambesii TaxID=2011161 RepID=A0A914V455_9BILA